VSTQLPTPRKQGIYQGVTREGNYSQPLGAEANTRGFTYNPLIVYMASCVDIVASKILSSHLHYWVSSNYFQDVSLYHIHNYELYLSDCFISTAFLMFCLSIFYSVFLLLRSFMIYSNGKSTSLTLSKWRNYEVKAV